MDMTVSPLPNALRAASSDASTLRTPDRDLKATTATPEIQLDPVTKEPVALRFPWLSRLASKLEAVAANHWPFKSLPVTGGNVDDAA